MAPTLVPDRIGPAIAAAEEESPHVELKVRLGSGRVVLLAVPIDLATAEALDLISYVSRGMAQQLAEARAAGSKILVPPGIVVPGR
ncbi:MAG TPA: hypothetical protein VN773_09930 [Verrucomicrobiae bacterium]|nr:hypothetical protein [Verrucomicrobiae bacterium]